MCFDFAKEKNPVVGSSYSSRTEDLGSSMFTFNHRPMWMNSFFKGIPNFDIKHCIIMLLQIFSCFFNNTFWTFLQCDDSSTLVFFKNYQRFFVNKYLNFLTLKYGSIAVLLFSSWSFFIVVFLWDSSGHFLYFIIGSLWSCCHSLGVTIGNVAKKKIRTEFVLVFCETVEIFLELHT